VSAFRAGHTVDDYCAPCKTVRRHTVLASSDTVTRVICDYCGSQHNFRGGGAARAARREPGAAASAADAFPLVGERERSGPR
jgi:hypothetical protein